MDGAHDEDMRQETARIVETLRPCPHCGPMPARPELVRGDASRRWQVFCGPCGSSSGSTREPQDAADAWNSRHVAGPELGTTSAAQVALAVFLGNRLADLSAGTALPVYGLASPERQTEAFALAREVLEIVNRSLAS
jgi:hypothetical protein